MQDNFNLYSYLTETIYTTRMLKILCKYILHILWTIISSKKYCILNYI